MSYSYLSKPFNNLKEKSMKALFLSVTSVLFTLSSINAEAGTYLVYPLWESGSNVAGSQFSPNGSGTQFAHTNVFCSTNNNQVESITLHFQSATDGWSNQYSLPPIMTNGVSGSTIRYSTSADPGFADWLGRLNASNQLGFQGNAGLFVGRLDIEFSSSQNHSTAYNMVLGFGNAPACFVDVVIKKGSEYSMIPIPMSGFANY